jgi:phosphoserine aminotransferase
MTDRVYNFSAGPAMLPEPVINQAQKDLWNIFGSGMGVAELSHRGPEFDRILEEALADCRAIGRIPDSHHILFLQGGATTQTDMIPMAFLREGGTADYLDTGKWMHDAIKEARVYAAQRNATIHVAASSKEINYERLPTEAESNYTPNADYCVFCTNNTIFGTQYHGRYPAAPSPLIADMSSDYFSRPMDWSRLAMAYGGAQKNLGPSGQALVVISDEFLRKAPDTGKIGVMFDYKAQVKNESRFNTPNTFAIYLMGLTFKWLIKEFGSLEAVQQYNEEKAALIYDFIDSQDFYVPHVKVKGDRSMMNITFKCPTPELDAQFLVEADAQGLKTLAGHRATGGMRASIYNAMPREGCVKLVEFMKAFAHANKSAAVR